MPSLQQYNWVVTWQPEYMATWFGKDREQAWVGVASCVKRHRALDQCIIRVFSSPLPFLGIRFATSEETAAIPLKKEKEAAEWIPKKKKTNRQICASNVYWCLVWTSCLSFRETPKNKVLLTAKKMCEALHMLPVFFSNLYLGTQLAMEVTCMAGLIVHIFLRTLAFAPATIWVCIDKRTC